MQISIEINRGEKKNVMVFNSELWLVNFKQTISKQKEVVNLPVFFAA